ncbi:MAG TPA: hypothetical protein VNZ54_10565 [bacterium]|jgi:hypothetical protein|nr:hypothetical protein [bacterium]
MKEMTSYHDDIDKRLSIFFGLGCFLLSALVGLLRAYTLDEFMIQGVLALAVGSLAAYGFAVWLRAALRSVQPEEPGTPSNVERRTNNAEDLDIGHVVTASQLEEAVIAEDPASPSGKVINFTLPELEPGDLGIGSEAPAQPGAPAAGDADLPPPPVPSWIK